MAILTRGDDVEAVARGGVEFGEHWGGEEAGLGALACPGALGLPGRIAGQRSAGVAGVRALVKDEFAAGVPGVDVALQVVGHDLDAAVAEQVAGGGRLEHGVIVRARELSARERSLAGVQRQRFGVHGPARQVGQAVVGGGVVLVSVDHAVGVGHDELV